MYAIEFQARVKNGLIEIPKEFHRRLTENIRVILLVEPQPPSNLALEEDETREDWLALSQQFLANAYDEDEVEYPLNLIKESNLDYDRR